MTFLFRKVLPGICAKVTKILGLYDNIGGVLSSFLRQMSLFIREKLKDDEREMKLLNS